MDRWPLLSALLLLALLLFFSSKNVHLAEVAAPPRPNPQWEQFVASLPETPIGDRSWTIRLNVIGVAMKPYNGQMVPVANIEFMGLYVVLGAGSLEKNSLVGCAAETLASPLLRGRSRPLRVFDIKVSYRGQADFYYTREFFLALARKDPFKVPSPDDYKHSIRNPMSSSRYFPPVNLGRILQHSPGGVPTASATAGTALEIGYEVVFEFNDVLISNEASALPAMNPLLDPRQRAWYMSKKGPPGSSGLSHSTILA